MMIRKPLMFAALLALVALGLTANSAFGAGVHQVPIHGSYSGTVAFTSPSTVAFTGTGISSHLGRGTNQGVAVITGPDGSIPGGLDNVNTETYTAANGDTFTLTSQDVAIPVAPGVTHGTGQWKVTGGTGRFSNATGKGTIEGYADFNRGVFSFQFNGTISAPSGG
jgi:hypothetical protein